MILTLFFIFEQVFTFYQLITSVTLMRDPLKTAMGSWARSIRIITILLLLLLLLLFIFNDFLWKYMDPETQNHYLKSSTCQ